MSSLGLPSGCLRDQFSTVETTSFWSWNMAFSNVCFEALRLLAIISSDSAAKHGKSFRPLELYVSATKVNEPSWELRDRVQRPDGTCPSLEAWIDVLVDSACLVLNCFQTLSIYHFLSVLQSLHRPDQLAMKSVSEKGLQRRVQYILHTCLDDQFGSREWNSRKRRVVFCQEATICKQGDDHSKEEASSKGRKESICRKLVVQLWPFPSIWSYQILFTSPESRNIKYCKLQLEFGKICWMLTCSHVVQVEIGYKLWRTSVL